MKKIAEFLLAVFLLNGVLAMPARCAACPTPKIVKQCCCCETTAIKACCQQKSDQVSIVTVDNNVVAAHLSTSVSVSPLFVSFSTITGFNDDRQPSAVFLRPLGRSPPCLA